MTTQTAIDRRRRKALESKGARERRVLSDAGLELREQGNGFRLSGYAAVTNTPYEVGGWVEVVKRGAFKRTLSEHPDTILLANHEGLPLARTRSSRGGPGTLRLSEDATGLFFEADLDPLDHDAQQLVRKVRRGDLNQCSMAFRATDDDWDTDFSHRTLLSCSLHAGDVSVVGMAASPQTSVSVRKARALARSLGPDSTQLAREQLMLLRVKSRAPERSVDPWAAEYRARLAALRRGPR